MPERLQMAAAAVDNPRISSVKLCCARPAPDVFDSSLWAARRAAIDRTGPRGPADRNQFPIPTDPPAANAHGRPGTLTAAASLLPLYLTLSSLHLPLSISLSVRLCIYRCRPLTNQTQVVRPPVRSPVRSLPRAVSHTHTHTHV